MREEQVELLTDNVMILFEVDRENMLNGLYGFSLVFSGLRPFSRSGRLTWLLYRMYVSTAFSYTQQTFDMYNNYIPRI